MLFREVKARCPLASSSVQLFLQTRMPSRAYSSTVLSITLGLILNVSLFRRSMQYRRATAISSNIRYTQRRTLSLSLRNAAVRLFGSSIFASNTHPIQCIRQERTGAVLREFFEADDGLNVGGSSCAHPSAGHQACLQHTSERNAHLPATGRRPTTPSICSSLKPRPCRTSPACASSVVAQMLVLFSNLAEAVEDAVHVAGADGASNCSGLIKVLQNLTRTTVPPAPKRSRSAFLRVAGA
jgi:hypothetical protein